MAPDANPAEQRRTAFTGRSDAQRGVRVKVRDGAERSHGSAAEIENRRDKIKERGKQILTSITTAMKKSLKKTKYF